MLCLAHSNALRARRLLLRGLGLRLLGSGRGRRGLALLRRGLPGGLLLNRRTLSLGSRVLLLRNLRS